MHHGKRRRQFYHNTLLQKREKPLLFNLHRKDLSLHHSHLRQMSSKVSVADSSVFIAFQVLEVPFPLHAVSRLRQGFSGLSHTSHLEIGTPVVALPGAWRYRVSAGTGRPGVSIL